MIIFALAWHHDAGKVKTSHERTGCEADSCLLTQARGRSERGFGTSQRFGSRLRRKDLEQLKRRVSTFKIKGTTL